jgi:3D (Asp-Asp-Asp) domain-containing protein
MNLIYSQTGPTRTAVTIGRRARSIVGLAVAVGLSGYFGIVVKDLVTSDAAPEPLSLLQYDDSGVPTVSEAMATPASGDVPTDPLADELAAAAAAAAADDETETIAEPVLPLEAELPPNAVEDLSIRVFDGRLVRPAKAMWMVVTAYSPDERSCPGTADNITASNHHVLTNAHRLVAADSRVLPLGSMISIPGYDRGQIVPVLDRGGAIKGNRLDVLFPTHEQARAWGVRRVKITVWSPADGGGKTDWRSIRDSRVRD